MIDNKHDLMPESVAAKIPRLGATETKTDAVAWVKWIMPDSEWTWYVTEYDPQDRICFGLVEEGFDIEIGYFSLEEIENIRAPYGLRVERDLTYVPHPLNEIHPKIDRSR
jgi:hypothetical protein